MKIFLAMITLLLSFSLAGAEMYRWIEDDGSVTFKDTPPPSTKKRKKVKVYHNSDFSYAPANQPEAATRSTGKVAASESQTTPHKNERFRGTVEIYVTSWCGYCKQAQSYMNSKGIPYMAYDIEKDSAAKQRHKQLGGRGVPLIIIGSNKMSGFSPELLESYMNNSR